MMFPVVLSAGYYDTYDFLGRNGIPNDTTTAYIETVGYGKRYGGGCKGRQTGEVSYGLIDNLHLTYNGNQQQSVYDNATDSVFGSGMEFKDGAHEETEYVYDANGNLTKDLNKNIVSIQYNLLNLPERVEYANCDRVLYLYAADGSKFRSAYVSGTDTVTVSYFGNAVYEEDVLLRFLTSDGYVTVSAGTGIFQWSPYVYCKNNPILRMRSL